MNMKSSVHPTVIFAGVLGLLGIVLLSLQFSVSIEPIESDPLLSHSEPLTSQFPTEEIPDSVASSPEPTSTQSVKQDTAKLTNTEPRQKAIPGGLRIANQTDQPVRVALLTQKSKPNSSDKSAFSNPVHWDFAPGEGGTKGLILSLPKGNLKLKKGDILVAFAQDGSRRYWGPYVVGETNAPIRDRKTGEWQLILN